MPAAATTAVNVKQAVPVFNVTDMDASLRFYIDGLGFVRTGTWIVDGRVRWCSLRLGGATLVLQEYRPGGRPEGSLGQGVIVCAVCDDAIAVYHELISRRIASGPPFVRNRLCYVAVQDPDGYLSLPKTPYILWRLSLSDPC
jgi:catechol 2,3-dioxygenase-like lactoylglutathione lyase family enzyme